MGYACYTRRGRDQGYGVPAKCDHPGCDQDIDRGVGYACSGDPDEGCGLFFCGEHLSHLRSEDGSWGVAKCERCHDEDAPAFDPTPDVQEWIDHKLTDESWAEWRSENPDWVKAHSQENQSHD